MDNTIIPQTNRPLYPKADPLRPFPNAFALQLRRAAVKRLAIAAGKQSEQSVTVVPNRVSRLRVTVRDRAALTLVVASDLPSDAFSLVLLEATVGKGASLHVIEHIRGGQRVETHAAISLIGQGSEAQFSGMLHGLGQSHHALHLMMHHRVPNTRGTITIRGVYEQESRGVISGCIKVAPAAQKTNSYFRDDILLLDQAMADSEPTLEIEADDVKASHGSTTGRVSDEQLFYLQSRGITAQRARRMITDGFLQPILDRVPLALRRRV